MSTPVALAGVPEQLNIGAIPLLIGVILVICMLDLIMPGSLPKGVIFALMLPYTTIVLVLWFVLGIPPGPGYPVSVE